MANNSPFSLIILDGFGYQKNKSCNAIYHAHTPNLDTWMQQYPHALLKAHGSAVGLPENSIGNSEVGHLTIGSGTIIQSSLKRINTTIQSQSFFKNKHLITAIKTLKKKNTTLHIMGLLSDAGVHSHLNHLYAFLDAAKQQNITNIIIHAFLDGRDTSPESAEKYLSELEKKLDGIGKIGTISGRFYAMDRDKNWDRTEKLYQRLTHPLQDNFTSWQKALEYYYKKNITDEFIPPTQLEGNKIIENGDGIIFFNFRADRARQITYAFTDPKFDHFSTQPLDLTFFITPTEYAYDLKQYALYPHIPAEQTLKSILFEHNKTIFSISETEKYAHITYFFDGGKEEIFKTETRKHIPSIKAQDYTQHPEMSADAITQAVLNSLKTNPCDFYLINYANADMVGHSGNFKATVKAIEYLDTQLGILFDHIVTNMNGTMFITSDHGNAEQMWNEKTNQPHTAHTTNPVPFIIINKNIRGRNISLPLTQLADITPFILKTMGLSISESMR